MSAQVITMSAVPIAVPLGVKRVRSQSVQPLQKRKAKSPAKLTPQSLPVPKEVLKTGDGTVLAPFVEKIRETPNLTDCLYCYDDKCVCDFFSHTLENVFSVIKTKRIVSTSRRRDLCAKSILPTFVQRLARILNIKSTDTFYDLGCGNGSVLFQIAYLTGAKCVGVELSEHNAQVAKDAWEMIRPILETNSGRKMPEIEIIAGNLCDLIAKDEINKPNTVIWTANLLMPKAVTQHMAERFRTLPKGARIACFDDFYPHARSLARIRDPEAFTLFDMRDHIWTTGTVEWTLYEGKWYSYERK